LKELDNSGWKIENVHREDETHEKYSFALSNNGFARYIVPFIFNMETSQ
jgi:hypothetical protein